MQPFSKTLALWLLIAVMAAPWAGYGLAKGTETQPPVAGCHSSGKKIPASTPINHDCCQAAHDRAILPQPTTMRPLLVRISTANEFEQTALAVLARIHTPSLLIQPGDPPVTSPLLI